MADAQPQCNGCLWRAVIHHGDSVISRNMEKATMRSCPDECTLVKEKRTDNVDKGSLCYQDAAKVASALYLHKAVFTVATSSLPEAQGMNPDFGKMHLRMECALSSKQGYT